MLLSYSFCRLAVSKLGLINGLADGPIPEKRLEELPKERGPARSSGCSSSGRPP